MRMSRFSEEERRRNELLQQLKQVEQNTLDSSKRSLGMLIESENIGLETARVISRQREKLTNTENRLDEIDSTLKDTQYNINGIKSVYSSLKQWWTTPEQPSADGKNSKLNPISSSSSIQSKQDQPVISKNLSSAVENSPTTLQFSQASHPECMSSGLSPLKDLSQGVGTEIEKQNSVIDRIHVKVDKVDLRMNSLNARMNRLLKK